MVSFRTVAPLLTVGLLIGAAACANGSTPDASGVQPTASSNVTEPEVDKVPSAPATNGPDAGQNDTTGTPCELAPQSGCASNETCDVLNKSTGETGCILAGGGPVGSTCTTSSQCEKGLTCANGTCRSFCDTPGNECQGAGAGVCIRYLSLGQAVPDANVCTITCDPLNSSAACGTNTCTYDQTLRVTDCAPGGTGLSYDPCTSNSDCAPNRACMIVDPALGGLCMEWCDLAGEETIGILNCGLVESCEDVYEGNGPTVGGRKLGHCMP